MRRTVVNSDNWGASGGGRERKGEKGRGAGKEGRGRKDSVEVNIKPLTEVRKQIQYYYSSLKVFETLYMINQKLKVQSMSILLF